MRVVFGKCVFWSLALVVSLPGVALTREAVEADWARQATVRFVAREATLETDAEGGCDGVISGTWGFHTACEPMPWWQVDLGGSVAVGRLRIYNRCDGGMEARAARLRILFSEDGVAFRQVYEHDGTPFLGKTDNRPLEIALPGRRPASCAFSCRARSTCTWMRWRCMRRVRKRMARG